MNIPQVCDLNLKIYFESCSVQLCKIKEKKYQQNKLVFTKNNETYFTTFDNL